MTIVEAGAVANNWRRDGGWTDGCQSLGTSPFKDLGFPYGTDEYPADHPVTAEMFKVSWGSYLAKTGQYSKWTDRGSPAPIHEEWADYLQWAVAQIHADIVYSAATSIDRRRDRGEFEVLLANSGVVRGDAIMFTGFGRSRAPLSPACLLVHDFWATKSKDERFFGKRVIIVGSGETAASITKCLVEKSRPADIVVISPTETIYSRGESYLENQLYSEPIRWAEFSVDQRREFIRRTDRAVFSQDVQNMISSHGIHRHVQGRVQSVESTRSGVVAEVHDATNAGVSYLEADYVIDARGGDPLWFGPLLSDSLVADLAASVGGAFSESAVEASIGYDLAITGFSSKVFVPNLSALRQGPGFPNLSSLGRLADRVMVGVGAAPGRRAALVRVGAL
ncbi:SidA/IucD/PvdA family monooxygenase [Nocardia sp. NPDC059246]|uniref:SidA/IucD/PvdA family monooxygenase n=1 Tax=Nocardia sp. NPDC059246 TaxID=3346789 RepID=UPI0036B6A602